MPVPALFTLDVICPYCYLAAGPLGRLRAEGLVTLAVRPFEIHPETPREGIPLRSFGPKVDTLYRELSWMAQDAGMKISRPTRLPQSRLALEAIEMARAALGEPGAVELAGRIMAAYFQDDADVGEEAILRGLSSALGVPRDAQDRCFLVRGFRAKVDKARAAAEDALVTAVPAMDIGGLPLAGVQPYNRLRQVVEKAARRSY